MEFSLLIDLDGISCVGKQKDQRDSERDKQEYRHIVEDIVQLDMLQKFHRNILLFSSICLQI